MKSIDVKGNKEIFVLKMTRSRDMPVAYEQNYFMHILCHKGKAGFRMENKKYQIELNNFVIGFPLLG